jgi:hypothetical protein
VNDCKDLEVLLSLRAAAALSPDEAARVDAHLATCAGCRAEAARDEETLRLAKLAPPSDAEHRATSDLARKTLAALHRREGRAATWKRATAGFAAAAALLLVVLAPAMLRTRPSLPDIAGAGGESATEASWQSPDLDTLWSDSDVLDVSGASATSTSDTTDLSDAAVLALDL